MRGRGVLAVAAVATALACAAPAQADHHDVKITQVFAGGTGTPNLEYVELEMVAPGQNFFLNSNATVTLLEADGGLSETIDLDANLPNGQRGRRILVGSDGTDSLDDVGIAFGMPPNFTFPAADNLDPAAGAVCFTAPNFGVGDCVSWGGAAFTGTTPSATGGATPAIATDLALERRRPDCGAGVLDTNSPANWTQVTPDPFNNAAPAATAPACPNTRFTKKPKKVTTKRRAVFKFTATPPAGGFECKLDKKPFKPCTSPFKKRVKLGKHKIKVLAEDEVTPASYRWKVVED